MNRRHQRHRRNNQRHRERNSDIVSIWSDVGRTWTKVGLGMGKVALQTSVETLRAAADTLDEISKVAGRSGESEAGERYRDDNNGRHREDERPLDEDHELEERREENRERTE